MESKPNRLINEKSPYLLQHAYNPVDWYPWGTEAFNKAKKENKPIFLSIGYSTCHWCHVMEKESFEDPEVAQLMNDVFISIKVDREERPDIDNIYMTVSQMMTGGGGWPLNIILTPEKKPFFAATYIPKESLSGRIGMMDLVPRVKTLWMTKKDQLLKAGNRVIAALNQTVHAPEGEDMDSSTLKLAYKQLQEHFDEKEGGFGHAPKFPTPHNLLFLLRYWKRTGDEQALSKVEKTLQSMHRGGIYDHIGFGFHRYSTDSKWLLPHFEKMLYDQALITMAYVEAYQATKEKEYKQVAQQVLTYVLRDMKDEKGGFYSGEDADSEGVEGKFYLWNESEIRKILGEEASLFIQVFHVEKNGNFFEEATRERPGTNILHQKSSLNESAKAFNLTDNELQERLEVARKKLFTIREKRVHPHKDDKILTDWNGLMIVALAKSARVFNAPEYLQASKDAVDFILKIMTTSDGRLLHRYREGEAAINAHIDDYAFLIWALLEIYETSFEVDYLKTALKLNQNFIKHFWDDQLGGFYFTSDDGEKLLVRQKEIYDGAIPSGNSVAMLNLFRLGRMTSNTEYEKMALEIGRIFSSNVKKIPSAHTQLMLALDFQIGPSHEVVIAGDSKGEDTWNMLKALRGIFVPNKVVLLRPSESEYPEISKISPFTKYQTGLDGKATAYVCRNYSCRQPTTDIHKMTMLLGEPGDKIKENDN